MDDDQRRAELADRKETRRMLASAGGFAFVGIEFVAALGAGWWLGSWADRALGTGPWLMTLGVALGFGGALMGLWHAVRKSRQHDFSDNDHG